MPQRYPKLGPNCLIKFMLSKCLLAMACSHYAENETQPDANIQPTFVEVLKRTLPEQEALAREAKQIAAKVAHVLSRPLENVHIVYLPPGEGRVAFGGKLLTKQR